MTHIAYITTIFLHIVAALIWVGGMLFMSLMLVPALRAQKDPQLTARLIRAVGALYHRWGWGALALSLVTGLGALHFRGISHAMLGSADFWRSPFGETLAWKLGLYALVCLFSLGHDLSSARAAKREGPVDPARARRVRQIASWMGRVTLFLSLWIVFLGVMLVRGNPWAN